MIHVLATITLHPGRKDHYLGELSRVIPTILDEHGCLEYAATENLDLGLAAQGEFNPDSVTIVEKWTDTDALKAHLSASHMAEYRQKVTEDVASTRLQVLTPLGD